MAGASKAWVFEEKPMSKRVGGKPPVKKGKGLLRATSRRGTATHKAAPAERRSGRLPEPAMCERCGALFAHRAWRRGHSVTATLLKRAVWTECPACRQVRGGEYWGRVVIRGAFAANNAAAIRRRVRNIEARAQITQPQRRLVELSEAPPAAVLEVLTTSQKLAHRIVSELKKAFRGRARYRWSDDGSLFAVWEREV
jgi:hypothetical protein